MQRRWLRELRKAHGMTQEDLAQRMGKERSAISKYEAGVCDLPSRVLHEYAAIFAKTMDELYHGIAADEASVPTNGSAPTTLPPRRRGRPGPLQPVPPRNRAEG